MPVNVLEAGKDFFSIAADHDRQPNGSDTGIASEVALFLCLRVQFSTDRFLIPLANRISLHPPFFVACLVYNIPNLTMDLAVRITRLHSERIASSGSCGLGWAWRIGRIMN